MKCSKCMSYSKGLQMCRLGKVNPPTIKGTAQAMKIMGFNAACRIDEENRRKATKAQKRLLKELDFRASSMVQYG